MPSFSENSKRKLETLDLDLQLVLNVAIHYFDFTIIEGVRSKERQQKLFEAGKTKTLNSKHLAGPNGKSFAVDLTPYPIDWNDLERHRQLGFFIMGVAAGLAIPMRWGGDWDSDSDTNDQTFNDLVHFELL